MTTFRKTLRQLANEDDQAERVRLSDVFASQLELAFNQQGNLNQVALSDTEEVLLNKIDRLHEQVGDTNVLLGGVAEAIGDLRGIVERTASESAARLGKIETEQARVVERLDSKRAELDEIHAWQREIEEWRVSVEQRLGHHDHGDR